jgi:hypothetical protein
MRWRCAFCVAAALRRTASALDARQTQDAPHLSFGEVTQDLTTKLQWNYQGDTTLPRIQGYEAQLLRSRGGLTGPSADWEAIPAPLKRVWAASIQVDEYDASTGTKPTVASGTFTLQLDVTRSHPGSVADLHVVSQPIMFNANWWDVKAAIEGPLIASKDPDFKDWTVSAWRCDQSEKWDVHGKPISELHTSD